MQLSAVEAPLPARSTSIVPTYPEIGGRNIEFKITRPLPLDDNYLIVRAYGSGRAPPQPNIQGLAAMRALRLYKAYRLLPNARRFERSAFACPSMFDPRDPLPEDTCYKVWTRIGARQCAARRNAWHSLSRCG